MGIYYYLLNDTKKERIHLCGHIKYGPMIYNEAVHYAMINYMMNNQGDTMRMVSDCGDDWVEYNCVDLLTYDFSDKEAINTIVEKLNEVYEKEKYEVIGGIGIEKPKSPIAAQGPLDRGVRAQAWIRRHKNDDPNDGHLYIDSFKEDAERWLSQFKTGYAWLEPLVSVEALANQWEALHGFDKHGVAKWLRSNAEVNGGAAATLEKKQ